MKAGGPEQSRWGWRWFMRGVRLSVLAALLAGGGQAWKDFQAYDADLTRTMRSERGYSCAAGLPDETLKERQNEFGTINVRSLGCSSDDFYVSLDEVDDVRKGRMEFTPYLSPINPTNVVMASLFALFAVVFLSGLAITAVKALVWVWGRKSTKSA
ncbi:hypothetical protein [Rhizobium sp.]|uniref:hypothetical protein n=1 Tax=Rhizobium sp. TaxID=391 RepID=UPI0028A5EAAA